MKDIAKILCYCAVLALFGGCQTKRHAVSHAAVDSAARVNATATVVVHDTLRQTTERVVFHFDTVFVERPQAESFGDLIAWASGQRVRSVEIESSAAERGTETAAAADVERHEQVKQQVNTEQDKERSVDTAFMAGFYALMIVVCCFALWLVYRYFRF